MAVQLARRDLRHKRLDESLRSQDEPQRSRPTTRAAKTSKKPAAKVNQRLVCLILYCV